MSLAQSLRIEAPPRPPTRPQPRPDVGDRPWTVERGNHTRILDPNQRVEDGPSDTFWLLIPAPVVPHVQLIWVRVTLEPLREYDAGRWCVRSRWRVVDGAEYGQVAA